MESWKTLFKSRKFWLLILDAVISITLYFVSHYAGAALEDVKFIILALQPIFLLVIYSITQQNVAGIKYGTDNS